MAGFIVPMSDTVFTVDKYMNFITVTIHSCLLNCSIVYADLQNKPIGNTLKTANI